jgi:hypothetical protein
MSNEVTTTNKNNLGMPDDIAAMFGQIEPVLKPVEKHNSLRYAGKVWAMTVEGKTVEITMDVNGDRMPAPMVDVILLNIGNPRQRNRAMFETYEEGTNKAPLCWSDDSVTPHPDVKEPYSTTCTGCKMSVKGSGKPDDQGNETVACKSGKVVCVIPSNKPTFPALELRMKVTSLWQPPENALVEEKDNWRSFDSYMKHLAANGINNPAAVVTSIKFASSSNYPRLLFKSGTMVEGKPVFKFLDRDTVKTIVPRINSEEVLKLIGLYKGDGTQIAAPKPVAPVQAVQAPVEAVHEVETSTSVQETAVFTQPEQAVEVEQPKPVEQKVEKPKAAKPKPVQVIETEDLGDALSLAWD